ncbi:protein phosphatase 2C domain-containing protein [Parabacteroides sp. OttesenSCG-928-J18]|nr:protein phosphatase 2C domain-containing protein [Parabacteroides sp. OttesenSCG-928-J18]
MKGFKCTCIGASHIKSNKVCQDYSFCDSTPELSIAIVSDGHGGERYFRSNIGSKLACIESADLIREFVENAPQDLFENASFFQSGVEGDISSTVSNKCIDALRGLTNAIIAHWRQKILNHTKENPLSEEEAVRIPVEYHSLLCEEDTITKVYGCTLMGYVQTPKYWFAFQIGDGKCFSFHKETGPKQPILWDDACFLNQTTSLCDSDASREFRFTYQGDGNFPMAVFLGSDGLDDSFGEDKNLINFYIQVLKLAYKAGADEVKDTLEKDLPTLSKRGSQDDMSVACIYDETLSDIAIKELVEWQLHIIRDELNQNKIRIHKFHKERKSLMDVKNENSKAIIDYKYAVKEIKSAISIREVLIKRFNVLAIELNSDNPKMFEDDIPYEKVLKPIIESELPIPQDALNEEKRSSSASNYYRQSRFGRRGLRSKKIKAQLKFQKKKRKNRRL